MILQYGDDLHLLPSRPRTGLATTYTIELFKITLNGDPALRRRLLDVVVRIYLEGGRGAAAVVHKKKDRPEFGNYRGISLVARPRRQDTAEDHRSPPQRVLL